MRRPATRQSGMAVLASMTLMVIASSAAAVLTWHFAHEGNRTRQAAGGAQLRALLTASTFHASLWVDRPAMNELASVVPLPAIFTDRNASLTLKLLPGLRALERHVQATAQIDGRSMSQTLRFVKTRTAWALAEATLD